MIIAGDDSSDYDCLDKERTCTIATLLVALLKIDDPLFTYRALNPFVIIQKENWPFGKHILRFN